MRFDDEVELFGYRRRESGLYVPRRIRRGPIGIDLFAGCGGMSLGMTQAGFHMVAAVEIDPEAAIVYMVNLARPGVQIHFDTDERRRNFNKAVARHMGLKIDENGKVILRRDRRIDPVRFTAGSGWISSTNLPGCEHFWVADVRNLKGEDILRTLGLEQDEVDVVCGGPPCQGFSRAGKRDVMDPRNSLVFEFARLVLEIRPKAIAFENVPGIVDMVTPEGIPVLDAFCRVLSDGGFGTLDALKRSLLATSGVGIAMPRGNRRKDEAQNEDGDFEAPEEDQLALFA